MSGVWTASTAVEIGVAWLEREIAPAGDFGRRARARERAFVPGEEAEAGRAIARVHRAAREVAPETLASLHAAIAACPDPSAALARAGSGGVLADTDLFELSRFLDSVALVRRLAVHPEFLAIGVPAWPQTLAAALAPGRSASGTFYLADDFDAALAAARTQAAAARARYDAERTRLTAHVAEVAGLDHVRDGEFVLMREGAPAPLPPEIRVLREAATYYLCELALDEPALAALGALEGADQIVAEREDAVRRRLSDVVRSVARELDDIAEALGVLDSFVARARFAARFDACLPEVTGDACVVFVDARFLPLEASLAERAHRYVPLSLELTGVGVLTGPNMGGKSAALRTCGFVAACVALGIPVPAASARVPLFDEIAWIGVGAQEQIAHLLSSFGREVVQLRDFLERRRAFPLVLIDEFARTTSPREGRALLIALIEQLQEQGAAGLAATHLWGIAADAGVPHYAVAGLRALPARGDDVLDLDAAVDRIARVMDYRVTRVGEGQEPRADAIALADVLGLDGALVAKARAAL